MMILSIVATVVLLGALFYHRINLLLSSAILLVWTAALGAAGLEYLAADSAGDRFTAV